jgi:hypothetical protein
MTDYLNPSHIPYANSCVSCGAEMGEGDMVCKSCLKSWTIKDDEHNMTKRCLVCSALIPYEAEVCDLCIRQRRGTTVHYELPEWYKKQERINAETDRVRNLMGLKIWLIQQIEKETDETRLNTLKMMLEGMKE